jgi:hypothetical protein
MRLMRSTLLLASFQLAVTVLLAIVPVRLICLALNAHIHVNQFVHTVYIRDPHPFATFSKGSTYHCSNLWQLRIRRLLPVRIYALLFFFGSGPVISDGCVRFVNSDSPDASLRDLAANVDVNGGPSNNSVENCINACQAGNYSLAGLEQGTQCCTCFYFVSLMSFPLLTIAL